MTRREAVLKTANHDAPDALDQANEILAGLSEPQKRISPKYFYDKKGSELFDRICELPEYYLTRAELEIMQENLHEMAELIGPRVSVIEFGSGSSVKVRLLLDHLVQPLAYVPVDISPEYLRQMALDLALDYPSIHIQPVFADFTQPFELPSHPKTPERNLVFFPGSTIGNFSRAKAGELLKVMRAEAGPGGALLIGVDLRKPSEILRAAYNDAQGVTAEFNLNLLVRLNRDLGANFELERFNHEAIYDESEGRIEMRLVSADAQTVNVAGQSVRFSKGEYIVTEHSYKYSLDEFEALARAAGLQIGKVWLDRRALFSVQYLTVPS